MNIRLAAEESGLTADTIRFYERTGVLPRPPRLENGYRSYTPDHVATLRLARGLRDLSLPLAAVGAILGVAHDGTCGDLRHVLVETLSSALGDVGRRIAELTETRDQLAWMRQCMSEMEPTDERVPGLASCCCVELVAGS